MYGVTGTAAVRKVTPPGSYRHPDVILTCALALYGRFHMTPDWLYFRRDTPDRTCKEAPKPRDRCVIHDPSRKNWLLHPTVRLLGEYLWAYIEAIQRAPLSPADRRECYRNLTWWISDRVTSKVVTDIWCPSRFPIRATRYRSARSWPARTRS